jgi:putative ABC transport system substrate-binding protein
LNAPIILGAWRSGLRERGWIEGKNLLVEYPYTQPTVRYPALAAELTALSPDLEVAAGPQAAVAPKSATATIPIVFVAVFDPLAWLADVLGRIAGIPQGRLCELLPWNWSAHVRSVAPPQAA